MRFLSLIATAVALVNMASAQVIDPSEVTPQNITNPEFWELFLEPANETVIEEALERRALVFPGLRNKACKTFPGDLLWPNTLGWEILKWAVGGRLVRGGPGGQVCHNSLQGRSTYNEAKCQEALAGFYTPQWHFDQPTEPLWANWGNNTCDPTTDRNAPCTMGTHPHWVVDAANVRDVQIAVNWARNLNIRLVVRNTGHDFMGKSMGAGALSVWTHNFKEIKYISSWNGPGGYNGPAFKVGAGVQTANLYNAAAAKGKIIIGGECAGVGFAGGFIQGGGHGPFLATHGLAVDHVLEFEVVTPDGRFVKANANTNTDLFWAMRGGGAASWGVLISVTVKAYPDMIVSGSVFNISSTANTANKFWEGVKIFHSFHQNYLDNDLFVYYEIGFAGPNSFRSVPILAPGKTAAQLNAVLAPMFAALDAAGVAYEQSTVSANRWVDIYAIFEGEGAGFNMLTTSRMFSREDVIANSDAIVDQYRLLHEQNGRLIVGHIMAPKAGSPKPETAANPVWARVAQMPLINAVLSGLETPAERQIAIDRVNELDQGLRALSPGMGGYLNEAFPYNPHWQQDFYGANWNRLAAIKERIDPHGVFYAETAVGSQNWKKVAGDRLCPVDD